MTVTMNPPEYLDGYTVRFSWTSDLTAPTFHLWRNGVRLPDTIQNYITISVDPDEELMIEVLDVAGVLPQPAFSGRFTLCFRAVAGTDYYRIDEYVDGDWSESGRIDETGAMYYSWGSRWLEEGAVHQFRVIAIGVDGNEGAALAFSDLMVRHPDTPRVTYAYSAETSKVTIAAA